MAHGMDFDFVLNTNRVQNMFIISTQKVNFLKFSANFFSFIFSMLLYFHVYSRSSNANTICDEPEPTFSVD